MIKLASLINKKKIKYWGFDLFEDVPSNIISKEFSKYPYSIDKITKLLSSLNNVEVKLIKGNTLNTLKKLNNDTKFDFIFLDGGHSIETINYDFINIEKNLKKNSIVIFDDFYHSNINIIKKFGCNFLLSKFDKRKKLYKYNEKNKLFC